MAETILIAVGLPLLLVVLGMALYAFVSNARAAQDRRDYATAERDAPGDAADDATRQKPPEANDQ